MNVRWHIYFFGRVQGVGFRHTCKSLSQRYHVSGWVRNLHDGSVELVVEGRSASIRAYVEDICQSTHGRVDDKQITKADATGEFSELSILQ